MNLRLSILLSLSLLLFVPDALAVKSAIAPTPEKSLDKNENTEPKEKKLSTKKELKNQKKKLRKKKRLEQLLNKLLERTPAKDGNKNTLSLISLITGGLGLLLIWFLAAAGIVLGLAGLITGIIGIKKEDGNIMAILGTVFGGLTLVLFLFVIVLVIAILLNGG